MFKHFYQSIGQKNRRLLVDQDLFLSGTALLHTLLVLFCNIYHFCAQYKPSSSVALFFSPSTIVMSFFLLYSTQCSQLFPLSSLPLGIIMNKKSLSTEGNMYMVNLNHIEGAESKEGYESEAHCSDNESGTDMQSLASPAAIASDLPYLCIMFI